MCRFSACVLFLGTLLISSCNNSVDEQEAFAKVGRTVLPKESYQWFTTMLQMYPAQKNPYFPGKRQPATSIVETQVLFKEADGKNQLKSSEDWQWKQRYYPAQMYTQQILAQNLGFTEEQIEQYYNQHREEYKDTIQVSLPSDTADADTAEADSLIEPQKKDSVVYRPLSEVRRQIIRELFLSQNPPDSAFYAQMTPPRDTTEATAPLPVDSAAVQERWFMTVARDPASFYMRKLYREKFNEQYPDSIGVYFGEGEYVTPEDLEIILEWLPENARSNYENPSKKQYLVEWLLKWKLFSEQARESGFAENDDVQGVLDWAWKYEVASHYIDQSILPSVRENVYFDTSMIVYAMWDGGLTAGKKPDSTRMANTVEEYRKQAVLMGLEERINALRRKAGVEFFQSDWRDEKNSDPQLLMQTADSLLALEEKKTGQEAAQVLRNAEQTLRTLTSTFQYTETGKEALIDLAKVQTELANLEQGRKRTRMLEEAIQSYRTYLIFSENPQQRCNTFFMTGFIYDEHLERPALAEVNYKWILEHTPDCELADDAEFMVQHLNEPMSSIEELQAQSRRQGRPVEEELDDITDTIADPDTAAQ